MGSLVQDVCYGFRTLRKSPGFAAIAILSLALGVGANTAIFSFINAALLKPLEVAEPGRLVSLYQTKATDTAYFTPCSYPEFEYYRAHSRLFSGMLAYLRVPMMARAGSTARNVSGELVSPGYFQTLGLKPAAGRLLGPEDASELVAVVSEDFSRQNWGGEAAALGRTLRVGDGTFTIVGVAPASYRGIVLDWSEPPGIWIPVNAYRQAIPAFHDFDVVRAWGMQSYLVSGRLRAGVSREQAQAEMATLAARMRDDRPDKGQNGIPKDLTAVVYPIQQGRFWPGHRGSILTFFGALLAATGLVLLIACFNLANMLLARAAGRSREIAVRLALGAGRARVARQLLTESLLLAVLGGAAGLLVAVWVSHYFASFETPFGIPLALDVGMDARGLGFSLAMVLAAALVSGLVPALQASRRDLTLAIKQGTTGTPAARFGLRNALVIAQVALSVLLVGGAGLFVRTLQNARAAEPTVDSEDVVLVTLDLASAHYGPAKAAQFYSRVLDSARSVPGVRNAALVWIMPWSGMRGGTNVSAGSRANVQVDYNLVSPEYFETVGMPFLRGRGLSGRDGATRLAVINETFARTFWPGADPLGRQFTGYDKAVYEVAGVVKDAKFRGIRDQTRPGFYASLYSAGEVADVTLEIRAAANPAAVLAAAQARIREIDREIPLSARTLRAFIDASLSRERLMASLAAGLGALALALAAIGIYGVVSFAVAQRTREIGIRVALGATGGDVRRMVLRQVLAVTAAGIALGLAAALGAGRLIANMLYGVTANDAATYTGVVVLFTAVAAAAGYFPARRAARTDPLIALRWE
ncbi:MAG TPA: ABC transporter permease [Bryobacteraceae bacterium]|nr:ABC transporter permease [Bryobacteraceae bacterium]